MLRKSLKNLNNLKHNRGLGLRNKWKEDKRKASIIYLFLKRMHILPLIESQVELF